LSYSPNNKQLYCFFGCVSCVVDETMIGLCDFVVFPED